MGSRTKRKTKKKLYKHTHRTVWRMKRNLSILFKLVNGSLKRKLLLYFCLENQLKRKQKSREIRKSKKVKHIQEVQIGTVFFNRIPVRSIWWSLRWMDGLCEEFVKFNWSVCALQKLTLYLHFLVLTVNTHPNELSKDDILIRW